MASERELHLERLRKRAEECTSFKGDGSTAHDPQFAAWRESVQQSLVAVFGADHGYVKRFRRLEFWVARMTRDPRGEWDADDGAVFNEDVMRAEALLNEALEEAAQVSPASPAARDDKAVVPQPPIVVNVLNLLSQQTTVDVRQVLAGLDGLGLTNVEREVAEDAVKGFEDEARGAQRWEVLGRHLETLKKLGKGVYEQLVVPLLLAVIKHAAGLG